MKWYHVEIKYKQEENIVATRDIQLAINLFQAYRYAILKRQRLNKLLDINHKVTKVYLSEYLN